MIRSRGGKYQVVVYTGRINGKDTYLRQTVTVFDDAKRLEHRWQREVEEGSHSRNAAATVKDLLDRWLAQAGPDLSPTTLRTYQGYVDGRIVPELGDLKLRKLTPSRLDQFYTVLRQTLTPATVRKIHGIIRTACSQAVKWGWLGSNPATKASPPKAAHVSKAPPDPAAMRTMLAALEATDPDLGTYLRLAAITGARRGELCALRWTDIDFDLGTVTIARALICANGTTVEKDTKTHGIRRLAVDPATLATLETHRERERAKKVNLGGLDATDFVFTSVSLRRDGKSEGPWHPDAVTHRYRKAATKAGIKAGLHDWRHWAATHALAGGISVRQVADRLGHAQSSTTLNVYSHAIPAGDRDTASVLAKALDG